MHSILCEFINEDKISCNGTIFEVPEKVLTYNDKWFWIYLGIYVGLVLIAGLMSGLTMGLLSLDLMTLKVLRDGGTPKEKKQADRILPIVKRHHLLLVTLLLANAGAVEAMPIFLDRVSSPVIAIVISVTAVLIFGEVVPQALCTRFGLAIGAMFVPLVYVLMGLTFVVSWPLSKLLDCLLGSDHSTFFRRAHLKVLVDLHGPSNAHLSHEDSRDGEDQEEPLTMDEVLIIQGALDMKSKTVRNAMLPIEDVYMLNIEDVMDRKLMNEVIEKSHSRLPIYEGIRTNVVGVVLVKSLILLDPDDPTPVRSLLTSVTCNVMYVQEDMPLFDLLNIFQTGKSHIAFVRRNELTQTRETTESDTAQLLVNVSDNPVEISVSDPSPIVGIITLEDVIEELIQEEIIDETDVYVDVHKRIQVAKAKHARKHGSHSRQVSVESNRSTAIFAADGLDLQIMCKSKSQPAMHREHPKLDRHVSGSVPEESSSHLDVPDTQPLLQPNVVFT